MVVYVSFALIILRYEGMKQQFLAFVGGSLVFHIVAILFGAYLIE